MAAAAIIIAFLVLGSGVVFVAFSGGPARAREAYLTRGNRFFKIVLPLIYLGIGIAVPALVIANGKAGEGASGRLSDVTPNKIEARGKLLFRQTCASCHTLAAVNARGVTGPNLDQIGQVTKQRTECDPHRRHGRQAHAVRPAHRGERGGRGHLRLEGRRPDESLIRDRAPRGSRPRRCRPPGKVESSPLYA